MNSTPDPNATPERTPFDAAPADSAPVAPEDTEDTAAQARAAALAQEQAALEAKMALLPDYGDEAFPRRASRPAASASASPTSRSGKAEPLAGEEGVHQVEQSRTRGFGPQAPGDEVAAPGSVVAAGCLGGMLGNAALGMVLLGLKRAGLYLYGPGVLAVVVALVVLALLAGSWPKRVWLGAGGFLLGLVLSFGTLFLFVRPVLTAGDDVGAALDPGAALLGPQNDVPPPAPEPDEVQPS